MEFREIYCNNCKKVLGKYNVKFYSQDKIAEIIKSNHTSHMREGHQIAIRLVKSKLPKKN